MINLNRSILPHYIRKPQIPTNHCLPHHQIRSHRLRSLQLVLVQVCSTVEQVVCDEQGDSDHLPTPSHDRVEKGDSSGNGGALSKPGSWRGYSVVRDYPHLEEDV